MANKAKDYGTLAIAAGGAGVGGYIVGKSFDTSRRPPPSSAIASYAVIAPAAIGALAFVLLRKRNPSAAMGSLAGGLAGALWGFVQFPTTPAGIRAEIQNVINNAQGLATNNPGLLTGGGAGGATQGGYGGTPGGAGAWTPSNSGNWMSTTQAGYIGASLRPGPVSSAARKLTPFNRFSPGHTPRLAAAGRRGRRMGATIIPRSLQNGGSAFPPDAWSRSSN